METGQKTKLGFCHPSPSPPKGQKANLEGGEAWLLSLPTLPSEFWWPPPPFQNPKLTFWGLGWGLAKGQKANFRELGGLANKPKNQITNLIFGFAQNASKRPKSQFEGVEGLCPPPPPSPSSPSPPLSPTPPPPHLATQATRPFKGQKAKFGRVEGLGCPPPPPSLPNIDGRLRPSKIPN